MVGFLPDGRIAASTRPESGSLGLPGGKLEAGETAPEAALREAQEEGWMVENVHPTPAHVQAVEGFRCGWFLATSTPVRLDRYLEEHRIVALPATVEAMMQAGLGNENALPKILHT